MKIGNIQTIEVVFPSDWKVHWNRFVNLEPDNDLPIKQVFHYFDEDIIYATNKDYFIDLGYYCSYLENRRGFFRLNVGRGDFSKGVFYEIFFSRKTEEIRKKIELYLSIISTGEIMELTGFIHDEDLSSRLEYDVFSAVNEIKRNLSENEFEALAEPMNPVSKRH